jgi:tetrapyrrole methylase family protein / MazG family protein
MVGKNEAGGRLMTNRITVVGLGTGDESQLTLGVWRKLQAASSIYLRTEDHPVVKLLQGNNISYETFDAVYEQHNDFTGLYEEIADKLIEKSRFTEGELIYAVPGHPMVAERTVQILRERSDREDFLLEIIGGESFLDQAFLRFGFDPIEGFQLLDATSLQASMLNPLLHSVIGQVYDSFTASDVKLTLMEAYPDNYIVTVGHALGVSGQEKIVQVPLFELDRVEGFGNLSLIWVSRTDQEDVRSLTFTRLHEIVSILRSPEGCPWDREQTHASLRKNLIEEAYEVLETIDEDDPDHMCEELGDLLLQVMLHAQIEEEAGAFTVYDVIRTLNEKLIRRHPHVFGTTRAEDADEALANWQAIKAEEKRSKGIDLTEQSVLAGVPRDLPALMKAYKLQKKAATVGFDWSEAGQVLLKVEEEIAELKAELGAPERAPQREEELGDLFFALVNLSRSLHIEPEQALTAANWKFTKRFSYIEQQLRAQGKSWEQTDLAEMETLWQEAKTVKKL